MNSAPTSVTFNFKPHSQQKKLTDKFSKTFAGFCPPAVRLARLVRLALGKERIYKLITSDFQLVWSLVVNPQRFPQVAAQKDRL